MSWPEKLSSEEGRRLLELAHASVRAAVRFEVLDLAAEELPSRLLLSGASFVTLSRHGELRGCIGSLEARRPLAYDVAENAAAAALRDGRFPPVSPAELPEISVHVSVLGPLEPVAARSEEELLAALRPRVDGLVLEDGLHRATFLPAVWNQLPEPDRFLGQLRRKAGLPAGFWSPTIQFFRYEVDEIP